MLTEFSVKNLGTVASANIAFARGLTVISGETGTGKSMLLTGLRLLTGHRADAKVVRLDESRADVDAIWSDLSDETKNLVQDYSAKLEDDELYISRYVESNGKSRLSVGGKNIPTSSMGPLATSLLEIHGQADQLKLKDPLTQRAILDNFGKSKIAPLATTYAQYYKAWRAEVRKLKDLEENQATREFELRYQEDLFKRFQELAPELDELEKVQAEIEKLSHMDEINTSMRELMAVLFPEEGDSPVTMLSDIVSVLFKLSKYDEEIGRIADYFDDGLNTIEPGVTDLESYADSLDLDSLQKLHELEDRLQELKLFAKPFGADLNRAIEEAEKAGIFIENASGEIDIDSLRENVDSLKKDAMDAAVKLREARIVAANELSLRINQELAGLAMKGTEIVIQVTESSELALSGADEISFMATTQGKNVRPITKSASGGELSRIMLSLEVVTADSEEPKTFVFDEVDAGIGGATAIEVGKRLALLAKKHQVIVVSHLPQVAAFSDTHYAVEKHVTAADTETTVMEVKNEARVKEIARMLSGLDSTDSGLAHAEDLLNTAAKIKADF